jgi:type II secretory pathway pseudopilin PulG
MLRPYKQDRSGTLMPSRLWICLAELSLAFLLALAVFFSWRADRRERVQLEAELVATKQLLAAADARQHDRDAQLAQTLATLAAEKRTIVTPAQIVRELPSQISLPSPIVLQSAPALPDTPTSKANAVIPAEDLKPLYDFTIDCKACQAKLAAAQGDLTDERNKPTALTRERDDALRIARGGSAWRRIGRAAKWFLIGAAAGAVAAKTAH